MAEYPFTIEEVLNDFDKTFDVGSDTTVETNKLSVVIPAVSGKRHYIGSIVLTGTAGTGGAESLVIKKGSTTKWEESFTVGQDKVRQFQGVPFVGNEGEAVTIEASATNLTAGKMYVVYYTK
jgi:hypothetical protein